MFPRLPTLALLLALSASAVACAVESPNDAPIIDSVEAPLAVTAVNGTYRIPVTVLFHDLNGEAVTRVRYRLPPTIDGFVDVTSPNPTRESAQVIIVIPAAALDDDAESTADSTIALRDDGDGRGEGRDDDKRADDEVKRPPHGKGRGRTRSLQLSIVDGRGAESLPQSSTVTLH